MSYRILLLGAGARDELQMGPDNRPAEFKVVTLDLSRRHKPDIVWDLDWTIRMPIADSEFDEIHAYEVLEHTGTQGDAKFFFGQWTEFARILKPGGLFFATVPHWQSIWAWGDPSHRRVITKEQLQFLDQDFYVQVGKSPCSDFRDIYRANFKIRALAETEHQLRFVLQVEK